MPLAKIYIQNDSILHDQPILILDVYDSFMKRLKGLMFVRSISNNEGAFFINKFESVIDSIIHMLFMNFDIAVFWLDNNNYVIDKIIAKKWHLYYAPTKPAKTIIETHHNNFERINIGELLQIEIS